MTSSTELKISGIRLSELRPCDFCGGPLGANFQVIEVKHALLGQGAREVIGMMHMGFPLGLAETMSARGEEAVIVAEEQELVTRLFACNQRRDKEGNILDSIGCYLKPMNISAAVEKLNSRENEKDRILEEKNDGIEN